MAVKRGKGVPRHSPAVAEEVCRRFAAGESLRSIAKDEGMPAPSTVVGWADEDRDGFAERYARACRIRTQLLMAELIDIADDQDEDPQRSKLRVDTRKWVASKLLPKVYGEKVDVAHSGTVTLDAVIAETLAKHAKKE